VKTDSIRKNVGALLDANKEVNLEVNYNIKRHNKSFKNMVDFNRVNLGNACYNSFHNLFVFLSAIKKIEVKHTKTVYLFFFV
jgi:hypothetical protein